MNELLGKPIDRVDGRLKVTGTATYAAEFPVPNLAYGVTVNSTITKGRVKNIDIQRAQKCRGDWRNDQRECHDAALSAGL